MKILVIFTGGTIGSTVEGEYISTDNNKPYVILDKYNKSFPNRIEWITASPYTVLSENITCRTYRLLYNAVSDGLSKDYDGIIITHGSDTLQYSAAFLSLAFGNDTIPVVLVASNYVLEDERANGMENFRCAVDFIQGKHGRGVFAAYRNSGELCKIHCGSRLMPHTAYSDDLESLGGVYGIYNNEGFAKGETSHLEEYICTLPGCDMEQSGIYTVHACPGVEYPGYTDGMKAVLLHAYHAGTLCVESDGIKSFMQQMRKNSIPVYLVGANPETAYESCKEYEKLGINVLPFVSPVYAYMRLWMNNGKWYKK